MHVINFSFIGQVITHIRQSFPLVKITLTNLVFDSEPVDASSGAKEEATVSIATESKDASKTPAPSNSDDRLVCYLLI